MHFSWRGLLLAPLPVPLVACAVLAPLMHGEGSAVLPFFYLLIPACVISYGTTIVLFLPALFVLSLARPVTGWMVCLLGFLLGAAILVPLIVMSWASSGPDSGPPTENLLTFAMRWASDPFLLVFPVAGLITAALYWWHGTRSQLRATTTTET